MKMAEYHVSEANKITVRSGTGGYQPKYRCGNTFIKMQAQIAGYYIDDWLVEVAASKLGKQLKFNIVEQHPCIIVEQGSPIHRYGVASNNFEESGKHFISLKRLLGEEWPHSDYNNLNTLSKMEYMASCVSNITKIQYQHYMAYLLNVAIIDILVCNTDRHMRNLGVMHNGITGEYGIPPIFDCGLGMFVQEPQLVAMANGDLQRMIDYCYVEPYGENPLYLATKLRGEYATNNYLAKLRSRLGQRGLVLHKQWFPSEYAWKYFKLAKKRLGL